MAEGINSNQQRVRGLVLFARDGKQESNYDQKLLNLKQALNESVGVEFLSHKISDVLAVCKSVGQTLLRNGDLISRSQCMTAEKYVLSKIWNDIYYASVSESGYGLPNLYYYINQEAAADDTTDVTLIINFLKSFTRSIAQQKSYADFVLYLEDKRREFFDLEI